MRDKKRTRIVQKLLERSEVLALLLELLGSKLGFNKDAQELWLSLWCDGGLEKSVGLSEGCEEGLEIIAGDGLDELFLLSGEGESI